MLYSTFIVNKTYTKVKYKTFIGLYFEVSKLIHIFVHVNNKRKPLSGNNILKVWVRKNLEQVWSL